MLREVLSERVICELKPEKWDRNSYLINHRKIVSSFQAVAYVLKMLFHSRKEVKVLGLFVFEGKFNGVQCHWIIMRKQRITRIR